MISTKSLRTRHEEHHVITLLHTKSTEVFNANYNPFLKAANFGKKKEFLQEWRQLAPVPSEEFESLLEAIAVDNRDVGICSHEEAQSVYEDVALGNPNFRKKGVFVRMSAWYSIIQAASNFDTMFTAWRWMLVKLAQCLIQKGVNMKKLEKEALKQLHQTMNEREDKERFGKAYHEAQMAAVRKAGGTQLVLFPVLMHNFNFFNIRLMLLVAGPFWSEQTYWACKKTTAIQGAERAVALATLKGEQFLRNVFQRATFSAEELGRLGACPVPGMSFTDMSPSTDPVTGWRSPGVDRAEIPRRLASFLFKMLEARFWTEASDAHGFPGSFAGILSSDAEERRSTYRNAWQIWEVTTLAESSADWNPGLQKLRRHAKDLNWPINQYGFRLLAQHHFHESPEIVAWFEKEFVRLGDSETGHRIVTGQI